MTTAYIVMVKGYDDDSVCGGIYTTQAQAEQAAEEMLVEWQEEGGYSTDIVFKILPKTLDSQWSLRG